MNNQPKPWSIAQKLVRETIGKDIFLACNSYNIIKHSYASQDEVLTFQGSIDSELGALAVSYILTYDNQIFNQLSNRLSTILTDPSTIIPLKIVYDDGGGGGGSSPSPSYVCDHLSQEELNFHLMSAIVTFIMILFTWKIPSKIAGRIAAKFTVGEVTGWTAWLVKLGKGLIDVLTFLSKVLGFIWSIVFKLQQVIDAMTLEEKILWGLSLILSVSASIAAYILSGSLGFWGKLIISIAQITAWALPFYADLIDTDTHVG